MGLVLGLGLTTEEYNTFANTLLHPTVIVTFYLFIRGLLSLSLSLNTHTQAETYILLHLHTCPILHFLD
jgi:hypothetical protein